MYVLKANKIIKFIEATVRIGVFTFPFLQCKKDYRNLSSMDYTKDGWGTPGYIWGY